MKVAVCILAKDEAGRIAAMLKQISRQLIMDRPGIEVEVHVVANGCTDDTVAVAAACSSLFASRAARFEVHDLIMGGKSRAWNLAVHQLVSSDVDRFVFCDADIEIIDERIFLEMLSSLDAAPHQVKVCAGSTLR